MSMVTESMDQTKAAGRFSLPWDLSTWSARERLLEALLTEIDSLDWANPELLQLLSANPAFQPRFLLALLGFAYATGTCESDELVALYHRDPLLKAHFPGQAPTTHVITRFRRDNRSLLKWCLGQLFKQAVRDNYEMGEQLLPAGLRQQRREPLRVGACDAPKLRSRGIGESKVGGDGEVSALVHVPVAIGILQHRDDAERASVRRAHRIITSLGHKQPSALIEREGHGINRERLGGDERGRKTRLDLECLERGGGREVAQW